MTSEDTDELYRDKGRWRPASNKKSAVVVSRKPLGSAMHKRVEGVPVRAEILFGLIKDGKTATGAFRFARKRLSEFSDDQIWGAYDEWLEGKVPTIFLSKEEVAKRLFGGL